MRKINHNKIIRDLKKEVKLLKKHSQVLHDENSFIFREYKSYKETINELANKNMTTNFEFKWNGLFSVLFDLVLTFTSLLSLAYSIVHGYWWIVAINALYIIFIYIKRF